MTSPQPCPDCLYAQQERAGMLMEQGHSVIEADAMVTRERCQAHQLSYSALELFKLMETQN